MGSFSLSFFKKILIFNILFLAFSAFGDVKIEGVKLPAIMKCAGQDIALSGHGLRTATFFKIKIYVAGFYAGEKISSSNLEKLAQRPLCFSFTYLKDFSDSDVDRAWSYQFEESSEHSYPKFKDDVKLLKNFFGKIYGERNQVIELSQDSTFFYENGKPVGEIKGADFQKAFLSIWFGKKPPTEELKKSLLGHN